jgi:uncharacterized protein (TIGR00725 family)
VKSHPGLAVRIGVIGASRPDPDAARNAYEVGRLIARGGAILICGGLSGVMNEAAHGAADEGGVTVGILPGDDPRTANPHIRIPIATGMGYARNIIIVRSADALIAIGGSYGTLSEIAYALNLKVPLVGLGTWDVGKIDSRGCRMLPALSPAEAVEKAFELAHAKRNAERTGKGY